MTTDSRPQLIVVGSGGQPYREYSFATLAEHYRVSAVLAAAPTWQLPYLDRHTVVDLGDRARATQAVAGLIESGSPVGLLTWDETALEWTAWVAERLGLAHMSPSSTARCRDKYLTRSLLACTDLPTVRYGLVQSAAQAQAEAGALGYPVVVKPRALAGSIGVVLAADPDALRAAFEIAEGAAYSTLPTGHGVLIEEFLSGPEISIDSVVRGGEVTCVQVARKRLGFDPYFEEVGHLVCGWAHEPWADEVRALVTAAHRVLGVDLGVTHAEVRLTPAGPRLVELNGRLGGDLIPALGRLATGIDLVHVAAQLALGEDPDLTPDRERFAEVRFVYPARDGRVRRIDLDRARSVPGIEQAVVLAEPGTVLRLPPRQAIPRLAALVAVADSATDCANALDAAEVVVDSELETTAVSYA